MTRPDEIRELERLLAEASPVPWRYEDLDGDAFIRCEQGAIVDVGAVEDADAAFIVAAVNALPSLLSALTTAKKRGESTQEFYASRFERLRKLADEHGLTTEFCNIVANGTGHVTEPHYGSELANAKIALATAQARIKELEERLREVERIGYRLDEMGNEVGREKADNETDRLVLGARHWERKQAAKAMLIAIGVVDFAGRETGTAYALDAHDKERT